VDELILVGDLGAAALPLPATANHHNDAIAAVQMLLDRVVDLLPGVKPPLEVAPHSVSTAMHVGTRYRGLVTPLHLIVEDRQSGDEIAAPSSDKASDDLHVLLRHRLPPFLREPFGGSTGLVDVDERRVTGDQTVGPLPDGPSAHLCAPASDLAAHGVTGLSVVDAQIEHLRVGLKSTKER